MSYIENGYTKLEAFRENGYVVLDRYDQAADPQEWRDIEFVDWKSSGETRFAPLASAYGDLECDGFWNHTPPKTDKDGVWVPANADRAPSSSSTPSGSTTRCGTRVTSRATASSPRGSPAPSSTPTSRSTTA